MPRQSFGTQNCHCGFRYTHHSTYTDTNRLVYNICGRVYLFVIVTQILKRSHSPPPPPLPIFSPFNRRGRSLRQQFPSVWSQVKEDCLKIRYRKIGSHIILREENATTLTPPPSWSLLQVHKSIITYALNSSATASFLYV